MKSLVVATGNAHKTEEIRAMLGEGWQVTDLNAHPGLPSPEETGSTFAKNAAIKALSASERLPGVLVLSDDSGLSVDVLQGDPGVHSARYSGTNATADTQREKLIRELQLKLDQGTQPPFTGRFHCCMVLARDGIVQGTFHGAVEGTILLQQTGSGGFGYDPLFIPEGYTESFGVLPASVKNELSHRGRALSQVITWLEQNQAE